MFKMNKETLNSTTPSSPVHLPKIRTGTDNFKTLILNSDVFVDKSLMIKELLEDSGDVMLLARPRRFGKSLNMDMIRTFLEIEVDENGERLPEKKKTNSKLFKGGIIDLEFMGKKSLKPLKISNDKYAMAHQGQFPVILINFKNVKGDSYQEIEKKVKIIIGNVFKSHSYLQNSSKVSEDDKILFKHYVTAQVDKVLLEYSLKFLSNLFFLHFDKKVKAFILIDEYDTPINSAYLNFGSNEGEFKKVLDLFREIFSNGLKTNAFLERGVITGILRIAKAHLFSDLNNISEYTLLDEKFSKFYGFTQEEVDELLSKIPLKIEAKQIKDWYNGYHFGGEVIYNPWSIMQCLANKGKLDHYWIDSGGTHLVNKVLLTDEIQQELQDFIEGKALIKRVYKQIAFEQFANNKAIFYSLLVFSGYLNCEVEDDNPEDRTYRLSIPNKELKKIYIERVKEWVARKLNINDVNDYDDFMGLLIQEKVETFAQKLQDYLLNSTSYHDLILERDYHNLMGGLLAPLVSHYQIDSNRETGLGRCDHLLIPLSEKDPALLIEYKICKSSKELKLASQEGMRQINNKCYDAKIKKYTYIKKIIKVSLAFYGKEVALEYEVDCRS